MTGVFSNAFMQNALAAGLLASVACGIIGTYVVARRIVFISGGISHTAYGGVGLGYLLGIPPLIGAAGFSLLAAMGIGAADRRLGQASDTVIGIIWAVGMSLGIIFVQLAPGPAPDLMSYLFGNILTVGNTDLLFMLILDAGIVLVVFLFYKEFMAVSFDEEFASVMGVPVGAVYMLLLALVALTVVVLIRVVGIIMVIALLTLPPATARLFVERMGSMMITSIIISAVCAFSGLLFSNALDLPSGPVIILSAAVVYVLSIAAVRMTAAWRSTPAQDPQ